MKNKFEQPIVSNIFFKEDLFDCNKLNYSQKKIIWCLLRGMYDYAIEIDGKKTLICTFKDLAHMSSLKETTVRMNAAKLVKNNIITAEKLLNPRDYYKKNAFWVHEQNLKEIVYANRQIVFDRFGGKVTKKGVSKRLTTLENCFRKQIELLERLQKSVGFS